MIDFANLIKLDGLGLGEYELFLGHSGWDELKSRARFPLILSNLADPEGRTYFDSQLQLQRGKIKIGIFSLVSPPALSRSLASSFPGFKASDPAEVARARIKELQPGSDLIILLSQLGLEMDKKLAGEVEGINLIFGSQPGRRLDSPLLVNDTLIFQLPPRGQYLGRLEVKLSGNHPFQPRLWTQSSLPSPDQPGAGTLWYKNFLPAMGPDVPEDPAALKLIRRIQSRP